MKEVVAIVAGILSLLMITNMWSWASNPNLPICTFQESSNGLVMLPNNYQSFYHKYISQTAIYSIDKNIDTHAEFHQTPVFQSKGTRMTLTLRVKYRIVCDTIFKDAVLLNSALQGPKELTTALLRHSVENTTNILAENRTLEEFLTNIGDVQILDTLNKVIKDYDVPFNPTITISQIYDMPGEADELLRQVARDSLQATVEMTNITRVDTVQRKQAELVRNQTIRDTESKYFEMESAHNLSLTESQFKLEEVLQLKKIESAKINATMILFDKFQSVCVHNMTCYMQADMIINNHTMKALEIQSWDVFKGLKTLITTDDSFKPGIHIQDN